MDFKKLSAQTQKQDEAKAAVIKANYIATVLYTVGGGKTKVMLDLAAQLFDDGKINNILYLCDSRRLRDSETDGFLAEVNKWQPQLKKIMKCECYQSFYKKVGEEWDLVLGDEIDMCITAKYVQGLLHNKFKYKILVSGTITKAKRKILDQIAPVVFEFLTEDAEDAGIINKSRFHSYNYRMTEQESEKYRWFNKKIMLISMTDGTDSDAFQFWVRKRKHFMNKLESSIVETRKVMFEFYRRDHSNRLVIFCELTEVADKVCRYSFHGENEKDDNLTKFQNGEVNALSTVAKIKRGINLKNTNIAIFKDPPVSPTEFSQRYGRMKRLDKDRVSDIVFVIPWYLSRDADGDEEWKPTIVSTWINRAIANHKNIKFNTFKL